MFQVFFFALYHFSYFLAIYLSCNLPFQQFYIVVSIYHSMKIQSFFLPSFLPSLVSLLTIHLSVFCSIHLSSLLGHITFSTYKISFIASMTLFFSFVLTSRPFSTFRLSFPLSVQSIKLQQAKIKETRMPCKSIFLFLNKRGFWRFFLLAKCSR